MTGRELVSRLRAGAVAAATVASTLVVAGQAQATYPGKNGAIAWEAYQAQQGAGATPYSATIRSRRRPR